VCGIVGFLGKDREKALAMLDSIRRRGPDDRGVFTDDSVTLGHVRLSILDLSDAGHQPMSYEHLTLVYNGEIYNYREIRHELEGGYVFESDSDTEVLLKAWHKWGIQSVERFRGMFAFAVYDRKDQKLWLVRDRVGVKPLYYFHDDDSFAFASETRALKTLNPTLGVEADALAEFFQFGYISSGLSIYRHVRKLPPAHYGIYDLKTGGFHLESYWSILPFFEMPKFQKSEEELINELESLLIESFKYRMVADVPVGVFLSGGIDSSIVTAILQKHCGNIHTFTIGFKEAKYNEADWASRVAAHLGTEHAERYLGSEEAGEILDHFVEIYDEPFGDSSGIPTTLVSGVAKAAGVKVVLSADGGDEVFCGYERYWVCAGIGEKIFRLPYPLRRMMAAVMDGIGVDNASKLFKIKNFAHKYQQLSEMLKDREWRGFYEKMLHNCKGYEIRRFLGQEAVVEDSGFVLGEREDPMQGMMLWDYHRYLPDDILVKVDRATMYHSIEGREPLLDHKIAEFMARVPFEYKYRNGQSKYLLRKVLERYLPKELIDRPKMGFGIPMFEWFGGSLREKFNRYFAREDELIDMDYARAQLQRLREGKPVNINVLWFILVYLMWKERYLR
jgi:asparagine synthase (glutamine-hydrolysing)